MSKHKKNGFTLVELLAVIVILAVILVIAVPQIMNVITESRKETLESSARLIASAAESVMLSNQALGISEEITCADVSNYNSDDYECTIRVLGSTPYVTLIGKGKFEGQSICYASKDSGVKVQGSVCPPLAVEKIEGLFTTAASANGLFKDDTADQNIRYTGASPKNYVKFNNETWRIIGIFNVKTASGSIEKLMKIVRNESIGEYSWDSSDSSINEGKGVNQWGESTYTNGCAYEGADLMKELNTLYLKQGNGNCFNGKNDAPITCNFSTTGIKDTYRGMIENVVWNTGAFSWGVSAKNAYNAERGTRNGKKCTSGGDCTDTVKRTTTWTGKVGLIYPSDYGYASTYVNPETGKGCRDNINDNNNKYCAKDNWLHNDRHYWTLSPVADSSNAYSAWFVYSSGSVHNFDGAYRGNDVRPSVYLRSNVSITGGDGVNSETAYQLSMN